MRNEQVQICKAVRMVSGIALVRTIVSGLEVHHYCHQCDLKQTENPPRQGGFVL